MAEVDASVNKVGKALTSLIAEHYGIPAENLTSWWAEGDGADGVLLKFELKAEMPKDTFDELLEKANADEG